MPTLPALLDSVRGLAVRVHEVVVVDDASRDATASVARAAGATRAGGNAGRAAGGTWLAGK